MASQGLFSVYDCVLMFYMDTNVIHLFSLVNCLFKSFDHFLSSFLICFTALLKCNWYIGNCRVRLPRWLRGKESDCQCRRLKRPRASFPGLGRSPGEGHGHPLQYSCLENPMDRGIWQARVHRVTKSQAQLKWLSMDTCCQIEEYMVKTQLYQHRVYKSLDTRMLPMSGKLSSWLKIWTQNYRNKVLLIRQF